MCVAFVCCGSDERRPDIVHVSSALLLPASCFSVHVSCFASKWLRADWMKGRRCSPA